MTTAAYEPLQKRNLDSRGIFSSIIIGFCVGFSFVKSLVYFPSLIFDQLEWQNFLVAKVYITSIAVSLLTGSLAFFCGDKVRQEFKITRTVHTYGLSAVVFGSMFVGSGIAIAGVDPGLAFIQTGAGIQSGLLVIAGGLLAALVYGFLDKEGCQQLQHACLITDSTIDRALGCEYWQVAIPFSIAFTGLLYLLENKYSSRWTSEIPTRLPVDNFWIPSLTDAAWNPYYAGTIIGFGHTVFRMLTAYPLDSIGAYVTCVATPLRLIFKTIGIQLPQWFYNHTCDTGLIPIILFLSAASGAFVSASLSEILGFETGPSSFWCIAGGFCVVFGALISGSCATELIISGCADLNVTAYIGTGVILISAILTGILLEEKNINPRRARSYFIFS